MKSYQDWEMSRLEKMIVEELEGDMPSFGKTYSGLKAAREIGGGQAMTTTDIKQSSGLMGTVTADANLVTKLVPIMRAMLAKYKASPEYSQGDANKAFRDLRQMIVIAAMPALFRVLRGEGGEEDVPSEA